MSKNREPDRRITIIEAWNIVKSLKTSRKSLINMEILEKHYRTILTESRPVFIKEEESIEDTDKLLEMDI